jgi:hypothetical protein
MFVITATFESERAYAAIKELLAMADSPERLAERLGLTRDLDSVKQGMAAGASFKRVITEVKRAKQKREIDRQIEEIKSGKTMSRYLGAGFQEKQVAKLEAERHKFDSNLETAAWFYQQPRVRLLSAIRDYALDGSLENDAVWNETDPAKLTFPLVAMFERGDLAFAQVLVAELEKPLPAVDPKFILQKFEGHRSITFDLETNLATYYMPARAEA